MLGGYNISPLIDLLDDAEVGAVAAEGLKKTLLMFDFFHDVKEKADRRQRQRQGRAAELGRRRVVHQPRPKCRRSITVTVFKVPGETNTDDLSPAPDAWSRPDIPLHALAMLKNARPGIDARGRRQARPGQVHRGPEEQGPPGGLRRRRGRHRLLAQVAPPTRCCGSPAKTSRSCRTSASAASASAARSRRSSSTRMEDSGALPIELDVSPDGHGRRDRPAPVRRQGAEGRRGHRRVQASRATCCSTKCAPAAASR